MQYMQRGRTQYAFFIHLNAFKKRNRNKQVQICSKMCISMLLYMYFERQSCRNDVCETLTLQYASSDNYSTFLFSYLKIID